jgi:hypothetical protein
MNRNFEDALIIVEDIIAKAPDLGDAMLLKAQILLEMEGQSDAAKRCLLSLVETEDKDSELYKQSHYLLKKHFTT